MANDFNSNRPIRAVRKPHRCEWCGEMIDQGQPAQAHFGRWEGDLFSFRMHPECHQAWETWGDEWVYRSFKRGTTEEA